MPQITHSVPAPSAAQNASRNASDSSQMEFEAKSTRDGAWYDVASFLSHRSLETADLAVWALRIVAGGSPKCRDLVPSYGALMPLLAQFNDQVKLYMLQNAT